MTLEEIKAKVAKIAENIADDEKCHGMEDELHLEFIQFVADSRQGTVLGDMAREILKTDDLNFCRW